MVRVKNPESITKDTKFLLFVFKVSHIYHAADQRSIDYPGHGYGAHTEDISSPEIFAFTNSVDLESELQRLFKEDKNRHDITVLEIDRVIPVNVSLKIDLE